MTLQADIFLTDDLKINTADGFSIWTQIAWNTIEGEFPESESWSHTYDIRPQSHPGFLSLLSANGPTVGSIQASSAGAESSACACLLPSSVQSE